MKNTHESRMIKRELAEKKEYNKHSRKNNTSLSSAEKKSMGAQYLEFFKLCIDGDLENLKDFLLKNPLLDINYKIPERVHQANNAVEFALEYEQNHIIQYLIEEEDAIVSYKKLANKSVFNGNIEMLRYLFKKYDFDRGDKPVFLPSFPPPIGTIGEPDWGTNAFLTLACRRGHLDIVKFLLTSDEVKYHADIHRYGDEPIKSACEWGELEIVKYLLESSDLEEHANIYADIDHSAHLRSIGLIPNSNVKPKTMGFGIMNDVRDLFIWEIGNLPHEHFEVKRYKIFKVLNWLLSEFYDNDNLADWFSEKDYLERYVMVYNYTYWTTNIKDKHR